MVLHSSVNPIPHPILIPHHWHNSQLNLIASKSIANRLLTLSFYAPTSLALSNFPLTEDTQILLCALESLGQKRHYASGTLTLPPLERPNLNASFNLGNAGTAIRFLIPLLAGIPGGTYTLHADSAFNQRPIEPLLTLLNKMGALDVDYLNTPGQFPLILKSHGYPPSPSFHPPVNQSSQFLSGLLLALPAMSGKISLNWDPTQLVSAPYLNSTLELLSAFNLNFTLNPGSLISFNPQVTPPPSFPVPPDASALSYFAALAWLHHIKLTLPSPPLTQWLQGDTQFLDILAPLGLDVAHHNNTLTLSGSGFRWEKLQATYDFNALPDTAPTFAALTPLFPKPVTLTGLGHLPLKESNRLQALAENLTALGQHVVTTPDSLTIKPASLTRTTIKTHDDHRLAMAFAILGTYNPFNNDHPWLKIENPTCCGKSFPSFFDTLYSLYNG